MRIFDKNGSLVSGNMSAFTNVSDINTFLGCSILVDMDSLMEVDGSEYVDDIDSNGEYRAFPAPNMISITVNDIRFYGLAGRKAEFVAAITHEIPANLDMTEIHNYEFNVGATFNLRSTAAILNREETYYVEATGSAPIPVTNKSGNAMEIVTKSGFTSGFNYMHNGVTYSNIAEIPNLLPGEKITLVARVRGNAASTTVYFVLIGTTPDTVIIDSNRSIDDIVSSNPALKDKFKNGSSWKYTLRIDGAIRDASYVIESGTRESIMVILTDIIKGNDKATEANALVAAASAAKTPAERRNLNKMLNTAFGKRI